ncbi:acyltransferase family protein [Cumulibacter manganitolerans]|uniref:acyltransferase family protein n=1 Tax=Cumulibacter manganitolerans TaxID=1884992 RepID=UPI001885BC13|nr:acyltransferase [Cumulibacter manganitolerans]
MSSRLNRIEYLDGIRALAVVSVLTVHWVPQYLPAWSRLFRGGYVGVDLFLVLSGYLITRILWRSPAEPLRTTYGRFLKRRLRRLYPALVGMLVVITALAFLMWDIAEATKAAYRAVLAGLQLTWLVALNLGTTTPFDQTWTLGWEWYFYLAWPLVVLAAKRRDVGVVTVAVWSAAAGLICYAVSVTLASPVGMYFGPLGRFAQLLFGSALGLYLLGRPQPLAVSRGLRTGVMAAAVLGFLAWTVIGPGKGGALYGVLGFPLVTACGMVLIAMGYRREADVVPRALSWAPLRGLGLASYSIYLWHLPLMRLVQGPLIGVPFPAMAVVALAATVALSWLSYRFLEKPFLHGREPVARAYSALEAGACLPAALPGDGRRG